LADVVGVRHALALPRGTGTIAAIGLGAPGDHGLEPAGAAGWHAGTPLVEIAPGTFTAPGCVVTASAARTLRGRRKVATGVTGAARALAGADLVTTRLPAGTTTLVVALEASADADSALEGLVIGLDGAQRTAEAPGVVVSGGRAHGLFTLRPDPKSAAVTVTIASDPRWTPAGVVGATAPADALAADLVAHGLDALIGDEHVSAAGSSTLHFDEEETG
jgi:hypothetical protein